MNRELADDNSLKEAIRTILESKDTIENKANEIYSGIKERERILQKNRLSRLEELLLVIGFFAIIWLFLLFREYIFKWLGITWMINL